MPGRALYADLSYQRYERGFIDKRLLTEVGT